jgi:hypothetical protein
MIRFVATVNIPGYLPMDDDPPVFDTARDAWAYLADERRRGEDDTDGPECTDTVSALDYIASGEHQHGNPLEDWPTAVDGTGTVYGSTPGSDSPHDLGLAYGVTSFEVPAGYVVLYSDGIHGNPYPDAPDAENTARTLEGARALFRKLARDTGRDNVPTAQGGPSATVYPAESWDGISYGDALLGILELGPRGGVIFDRA